MRYNRSAPIRFEGKTENPAFINFLHTKPCIVHGCTRKSSVHHPYQKGRAGKWASDYWGLPLCLEHHEEAEEKGLDKFEQDHNLDVVLIMEHQIHEFCTTEITDSPLKPKAKASAKPKIDKRFAALTDDELIKAGIRTQDTIRRIREGKIGKAEERKLKRYLEK